MATYTPNLGLAKPSDGEKPWGSLINGNFDILDALFTTTATANKVPRADANGNLDKSWIEAIFKQQGFINLIKNGNFASWSAGDTTAPDGWITTAGVSTIQRIYYNPPTTADPSDTSLGHDFVRLTTDGVSTNPAYLKVDTSVEYFADIITPIRQQNLNIIALFKVRTTSTAVTAAIGKSSGDVYGGSHFGSGDWEILTASATLSPSDSYVSVAIGVKAVDNTTNITFDVGEVALYIGTLPLPYQENPLDRALQAIHWQDSSGNNYEYRGLRIESGTNYVTTDGVNPYWSKSITFQKPFRKILIAQATVYGDTARFATTSSPTVATSAMAVYVRDRNDTIVASGTNIYFSWFVIGID